MRISIVPLFMLAVLSACGGAAELGTEGQPIDAEMVTEEPARDAQSTFLLVKMYEHHNYAGERRDVYTTYYGPCDWSGYKVNLQATGSPWVRKLSSFSRGQYVSECNSVKVVNPQGVWEIFRMPMNLTAAYNDNVSWFQVINR